LKENDSTDRWGMWRRKDPKEYRIEVRDYEEEGGKFLASWAGNAVIWFSRRFSLSGKHKQIYYTPGSLQAGVLDTG